MLTATLAWSRTVVDETLERWDIIVLPFWRRFRTVFPATIRFVELQFEPTIAGRIRFETIKFEIEFGVPGVRHRGPIILFELGRAAIWVLDLPIIAGRRTDDFGGTRAHFSLRQVSVLRWAIDVLLQRFFDRVRTVKLILHHLRLMLPTFIYTRIRARFDIWRHGRIGAGIHGALPLLLGWWRLWIGVLLINIIIERLDVQFEITYLSPAKLLLFRSQVIFLLVTGAHLVDRDVL